MKPSELSAILEELSEGRVKIDASGYGVELNLLGVDSVMLLSLLVAIEDHMSYEWSEDVDDAVFTSLNSISEFLLEEAVA